MRLTLLKHLAGRMPAAWQREMKRRLYRRQILRDSFRTDEPEYALLGSLISHGDWAVDVGANVGHYTKRMSDLVGGGGRVVAFEPVPETFSLLADNAQHFRHQNITLLNAAASDAAGVAGISIPRFQTGQTNFYEASLNGSADGLQVMTLTIDSLGLPAPVRLAKIDVEGHDLQVLRGMRETLRRDGPVLIIEVSTKDVDAFLAGLGYTRETLPGSPNHIYRRA